MQSEQQGAGDKKAYVVEQGPASARMRLIRYGELLVELKGSSKLMRVKDDQKVSQLVCCIATHMIRR
jgi:hypothetical protein